MLLQYPATMRLSQCCLSNTMNTMPHQQNNTTQILCISSIIHWTLSKTPHQINICLTRIYKIIHADQNIRSLKNRSQWHFFQAVIFHRMCAELFVFLLYYHNQCSFPHFTKNIRNFENGSWFIRCTKNCSFFSFISLTYVLSYIDWSLNVFRTIFQINYNCKKPSALPYEIVYRELTNSLLEHITFYSSYYFLLLSKSILDELE